MSQYPLGLYPVYLPYYVSLALKGTAPAYSVEVFPLEPLLFFRRNIAVYQGMLRDGKLLVDLMMSCRAA
jgi:hypothetical protein